MIGLLSSGAVMTEAYEAEGRRSLVIIEDICACPHHKDITFGPAVHQLHLLKVALLEPPHSLLADSLQGISTQINEHEPDGACTETFD